MMLLDHDTHMYCDTCQTFAEMHRGEILPPICGECGHELEEQGCDREGCDGTATHIKHVGMETQGVGPVQSWTTISEFRCKDHR